MKIVISDYPDVLGRKLENEIEYLKNGLDSPEIAVHPYIERQAFLQEIQDADGLLTAFVPIDAEVLQHAPKLKCVSINATGYNFVDLEETQRRDIAVCAIGEYCTQEVADHTFMLILALERNLKHYINDIDVLKRWQYYSVPKAPRGLTGSVLGIFGLGKIGRAVAARAQGFGMKVLAVDTYVVPADAPEGVTMTDAETLLAESDIVSNHMTLTDANRGYFDYGVFQKMKRRPVFINVGRGKSLVEADLVRALDEGLICAAGLDVLDEEKPDLNQCVLTNRENVLITPHAAFYSARSIQALQELSCQNIIDCLTGHRERAFRIVNQVPVKDHSLSH